MRPDFADGWFFDDDEDVITNLRKNRNLVEVRLHPIKRETDKAILVNVWDIDAWIPKSQIVTVDGRTFVPRWLKNNRTDRDRERAEEILAEKVNA